MPKRDESPMLLLGNILAYGYLTFLFLFGGCIVAIIVGSFIKIITH